MIYRHKLVPKPRNFIAKELRDPKYRQRVVRNRKRYTRKGSRNGQIVPNKEMNSLFTKIGYFCAGTIFVSFLSLILAFVLSVPGLILVSMIGFGATALAVSVGETAQKQHRARNAPPAAPL